MRRFQILGGLLMSAAGATSPSRRGRSWLARKGYGGTRNKPEQRGRRTPFCGLLLRRAHRAELVPFKHGSEAVRSASNDPDNREKL
jgi:hypothetical protein